jgi:hypothetical protein
MIPVLAALLLACTTPAPAPAPAHVVAPHDDVAHPHVAAHGGIVHDVGDIHAEAILAPEGVLFYLSDQDRRPIAVDGYTGSATVNGPSGVKTVDLMSMGDHLHAPVALVQGEPASAVLTLIHQGKAESALFETPAVGMHSHDHTPLHGGKVGMYGNYHLEYLVHDGEYQVWVTDEHRNPVRSAVTGTVHNGDRVVALAFDADLGLLSAKGGRTGDAVTVEVKVGDDAFSLPF